MSLTWFGWLYAITVIIGVMVKGASVGVRVPARETTPGEFIFYVLGVLFSVWGFFHVGVVHT